MGGGTPAHPLGFVPARKMHASAEVGRPSMRSARTKRSRQDACTKTDNGTLQHIGAHIDQHMHTKTHKQGHIHTQEVMAQTHKRKHERALLNSRRTTQSRDASPIDALRVKERIRTNSQKPMSLRCRLTHGLRARDLLLAIFELHGFPPGVQNEVAER